MFVPSLLAGLRPARAQAQQLVVRGSVQTDSGRVLAGVTVIVTMAPSLESYRTITDSIGHYELHLLHPSGDYLVYVNAPGFRVARRRVTSVPGQRELSANFRLVPQVARLAPVRAIGRPRPLPEFGAAHDPTAAQEYPSGLASAVPASRSGDLSLVASTIPGITTTPDGTPVAFGVPGQFTTTFNGVVLGPAALPPDLRAYVNVTTSPYDATIGGFGAGRINVEMAQGGRVHTAFGRATISEPSSSSAGPASPAQPIALDLSGTANGPFGTRNMWYNAGAQLTREWVRIPTLRGTSLTQFGLAPDSLARLYRIADELGIPTNLPGVPSGYSSESGRFVARVDAYADPARYHRLWTNAVSLTAVGDLHRSERPGNGAAASRSYGASQSSSAGQLIGTWIHLGQHVTSEFAASMNGTTSGSSPYSRVPGASIDIRSDDASRDATVRDVSLGGFPLDNSLDAWGAEATETLHFYLGASHDIKLYGRAVLDGASERSSSYTNGLFRFHSLGDFTANRAASFQRTLGASEASASFWRGSLAATDLWRLSHNLQILPGLRLDVMRSPGRPSENRALAATFGVTNANVPRFAGISPRIGFLWNYAPSREISTGTAAMGHLYLPARGTLSGGIGEFRNDLSSAAILNAFASTGLSNPARLECIGAATPTPQWASYASGALEAPASCLDAGASELITTGPPVVLLAPSYRAARSWRGNLQWGSAIGRFRYSANAVLSYNIDQPGVRDLNFLNEPQFTLASEGGRPVFVAPSSIDPASGAVSPSLARKTTAFDRVLERTSDLHSLARQITITTEPVFQSALFRIDYTLSRIDATLRGFDGSTFDTPIDRSTARSQFDVRHRFVVSAGLQLPHGIGATAFWRIQSGIPYTPLVATDVNGDGLANDRAFVFDPERVVDPSFAGGLRSLLRASPAARCLERQIGRPASANSCDGPWTSSLSASLRTSTVHVLDDRQATISLDFSNVLAGIDQLLHGSEALHGWGRNGLPDPVLYTVRAFDPRTRMFSYAANPRFGSTDPLATGSWDPFRVSLSMRVELGRPRRHSDFDRFIAMNPTQQDFSPAPADSLAVRLAGDITDAYVMLLRQKDSLLLTERQVSELESLHASYVTRAVANWRGVARFIDQNRDDPNFDQIERQLDEATDAGWALQRREVPRMLATLSPAQAELARSIIRVLIESDRHAPPRFRQF